MRRQGSDVKGCSAHSAKIAFYIRIFVAFDEIMKQRVTFLITFSIPRLISIVITWKFKNKFLVKKWKKRLGVQYPLLFFQFLLKNLFLNFQVITIVINRGILKKNKNVAGCSVIWRTPQKCECKMRISPNELSKLSDRNRKWYEYFFRICKIIGMLKQRQQILCIYIYGYFRLFSQHSIIFAAITEM